MTQVTPTRAGIPASAGTPRTALSAFAMFWLLAIALLVLNLGQVLGLGNLNAVEKMAFLISAVCYLKGKSTSPVAVIGMVLVLLSIGLCSALTTFAAFGWDRALYAAVALMSMLAYFLAPPTADQRIFILKSIAWIPLILTGYGLLLSMAVGQPMFSRDHTGASRLGGATIPAFLAAASYASAVAAAFLFAAKQRWYYLAVVASSLAVCAMSGTRTPTACAVTSASLIVLLSLRSAGARLALIVLSGAGAAVFLLTFGSQILIRIVSGSSSGREQMWGVLSVWVDRYPLFGVGFGHHGLLIPDHVSRYTGTLAAHNEYLRLLVELGYAGAPVFLAGLVLLFLANVSKSTSGTFLFCALLVGIFFTYASTDNAFFLTYAFFTPLAIMLGSTFLKRKGNHA